MSGSTDAVVLKYDLDGTLLDAWTWGGAGADDGALAVSAFSSNGGGCVIAGYTEQDGRQDGLVVMFDSTGVQQWARSYDAFNAGVLQAVAITGGGTVIAGGSLDSGGAAPRGLMLRFDSMGGALSEYAWSAGPGTVRALVAPDGSITIGGSGPSSAGNWEPAGGTGSEPADLTVHPAGYTIAAPPGSLLFPDGTDSTPAGYGEDDGEGGDDALVVWYSPGA